MTGYCPKRNANPGILDMTKRSKRLTRLPVAALSVAALALSATSGFGQSPQLNSVNDQTQTPIPGAGHDYQRMLGETVNFSNGSVSFKIGFPTPKERGITMPLGWSYNSASVETLDAVVGITPTWDNPSSHSWPEMDGWSLDNGVPHATVQVWSVSAFDPIHQVIPCNFESGMTFTDMSGVTHNLGTGAESAPNNGTGTYTCGANQPTPPANGDGQVVGTLDPNTASNLSTDQAISSSDFVVTDKDGTNYYFGGGINSQNAGSILFPTIEDRNGNVIVLTGGGYVDTSGKTIQLPNSNNSNSPFVVGNLTYTPTWGTTPVDYGISIAGSVGAGILCGGGVTFPTTVLGTRNTLSSLVLSNQESYSFSYGQYGLPSKIVYPDGGWVVYTWQLPAGFNEMLSLAGQQAHIDKYGNTVYTHTPFVGCAWQYQTPVLAARQVSFDGTHVAQTQSFTFVTNWYYAADGSVNGWTSKTATVTTTDNVSGLTSKTVYTYYPYYPVTQPYGTGGVATAIPLEQSIVYYDWGQSPGNGPPTGTPLKTVTKTWLDQFNMTSEITTDNSTGRVSGTSYGYRTNQCGTPSTNSFTNLVEQDDYDYGSSAGVMGPLAKRTLYNYYCFPVTDPNSTYSGSGSVAQAQAFPGLTIPPKVSNVTIEDGSGNIQAATQYLYDGYPNSQLSPATATQHDDSLYGTGMTIRGNVTSVTKCNPLPASPSASCSGPKVTYNYDITGQPASMTDGCGNAGGCSDVIGSNHTTTFSFADSPVGGNAPGNSNAYLTNITYPTVGNVALQKNFQYNYQLGYLTVAKDENGQPTNYYYNDPLNRLTQVNYPDLGVTKISYVDTAPSPTVTTQKLLSSSNQWETSVATMDGMEHLVTTQLTTDPNGTDTVATTYDGEGRAYTVTNPYRTSPNGTTQHHYDALGREIETVEPDLAGLVGVLTVPS